MRFGLVLGAGGATAWVFHTGVLRAIEAELGLQGDDASIIVGTSAGSTVGAAVRAGLAPDEIYDALTRPPTAEDRRRMSAALRSAKKSLRPLAPRLARHALPGGLGFTFAVAGLAPAGWFPTAWAESYPGSEHISGWPDGLWIPAIDVDSAATVVFGRDRRDVPVGDAIAASSAVPGMFAPKLIGDRRFVDGGVASSTHADLLRDSGIDLVVISAPMTRPSRRPFARHARRRLAAEVAALREAGIAVAAIRPDARAVADSRGFPRRNPGAAPLIAAHGTLAARAALAAL